MKIPTRIAAGALSLTALALGLRRIDADRRMKRLARRLASGGAGGPSFHAGLVEGLPEPARRYLCHAVRAGARSAHSVHIRASYRMRPRENAPAIDLESDEVLTPFEGFVWTARFKVGPIPFRVRDHYADGAGAVDVQALGLLPLGRSTGPDVARSSRHRLAIETVWMPSALLPGGLVKWQAVDADRARAVLEIEGESIPLTFTIGEDGRLFEVVMERHGDVQVDAWQPIPYGFAVEEERACGDYRIPVRLRGGWWYGTDRFDEEDAILADVRKARYL